MKRVCLYFSFFFILASCANEKYPFTISREIVQIPYDEELYSQGIYEADIVCKYRDSYVLQMNGIQYLFAERTREMKKLPEIKGGMLLYNDMFVRADSLFMVTNERCTDSSYDLHVVNASGDTAQSYEYARYYEYYNPVTNDWEIINRKLDDDAKDAFEPVWKDEDYIISYSGRGEYGSYLLFRETCTGKEYLFQVVVNRVLRHRGSYYVIGPHAISRIDNPHDGTLYEKTSNKRYLASAFRVSPFYPSVDKTSKDFPLSLVWFVNNCGYSGLEFGSGWIVGDQLFLVCREANETYIAVLEANELKRVKTLGKRVGFNKWTEDFRLSSMGATDETSFCCIDVENPQQSFIFTAQGYRIKLYSFTKSE